MKNLNINQYTESFSTSHGLPSNDLVGHSIDDFVQEIKPGVSLVTCCMNRSENLLKAIPTWLQCPEIDVFTRHKIAYAEKLDIIAGV